jgi:hypothetical protein
MMLVSAFFDESGKPDDHEVVTFGGIASFQREIGDFAMDWGRLLRSKGLRMISAKNAFNPRKPLSHKCPNLGIENRTEALMPFFDCIRKNIQVVTGMAIDVKAYKKLPSHYFKMLGDQPIYTAFLRAVLRVLEFTPDHDKISITCDDEEQTALAFYRLYRRIKKVWPHAKQQLICLGFGDDQYLYGLQAADMISGLMRLEMTRTLKTVPYDYQNLFEYLKRPVEKHERVWDLSIGMGTKEDLPELAKGLKAEYEKKRQQAERENSRTGGTK